MNFHQNVFFRVFDPRHFLVKTAKIYTYFTVNKILLKTLWKILPILPKMENIGKTAMFWRKTIALFFMFNIFFCICNVFRYNQNEENMVIRDIGPRRPVSTLEIKICFLHKYHIVASIKQLYKIFFGIYEKKRFNHAYNVMFIFLIYTLCVHGNFNFHIW